MAGGFLPVQDYYQYFQELLFPRSGIPSGILARHGAHHDLLPSDVPSRANIAALKRLGVKAIIAFSAVGSLQQEIKPRDFVLPTQIIDRTKGIRPSTFLKRDLLHMLCLENLLI